MKESGKKVLQETVAGIIGLLSGFIIIGTVFYILPMIYHPGEREDMWLVIFIGLDITIGTWMFSCMQMLEESVPATIRRKEEPANLCFEIADVRSLKFFDFDKPQKNSICCGCGAPLVENKCGYCGRQY